MPFQLALTAAFLAATAVAGPLTMVVRDQGPDNCADTYDDGTNGVQQFVADVGFYSDDACTAQISNVCYYVGQGALDEGSGEHNCLPANLPSTSDDYYAKVNYADGYPSVQILYTNDQTCPPSGPGAVFATLIDNDSCVKFNKQGDGPGVTMYPNGGSDIAKRALKIKNKRDNTSCSGFNIASQEPSESNSVQLSSIVDCTNSADSGCMITQGEQHTESVTTSYSFSAGGGVEGIDIGATFGMSYTSSETSSIQESFSVDPGQKGYLSGYSIATLFKGTFTGCDGGDQDGQALVLKDNGFTYEVVYTGA